MVSILFMYHLRRFMFLVAKDKNPQKSTINLMMLSYRVLFLFDYCRFLSLKIQGLKNIIMYDLRRFMFLKN